MSDLSIVEKYERMKEQNRKRQANYYAANREKIAAQRKAERELCKKLKAMALDKAPAPAAEPEPLVTKVKRTNKKITIQDPTPAPAPTKVKRTNKKITIQELRRTNKKEVIQDTVKPAEPAEPEWRNQSLTVTDLEIFLINHKEKSKTDISNIRRIFKITKCNDFIECLKSGKELIDKINNGKKPNGEAYGLSSIRGVYQTILIIIDNLEGVKKAIGKETAQLFKDQYAIYSVNVEKRQSENRNKEFPEWHVLIDAIQTKYGTDSKQYLMTKIYSDAMPVRDDLQLKIVGSLAEVLDDKTTNYIVVPPNQRLLTGVLTEYKTRNTNQTDGDNAVKYYPFNKEMSGLVRAYIKKNELKKNDYLFGTGLNTRFVTQMFKSVGFDVGINEMRHITATAAVNLPPEKRVQTARKMAHTLKTHDRVYPGRFNHQDSPDGVSE